MLLKNKLFLIAVLMMLAAGASEMGMSQWSSLFAEKGLQVSKLMGDLLGPFLFAIFMAVGRTLYGFYGHKINLKNALLLCGLLCILCYGGTALSLNPLLSLAGCAVCGFGVSLLWPGTLSVTARGIPTGGTAMFGLLAVAGDMGCALGPFLTGQVSGFSQSLPVAAELCQSFGITLEQFGLKAGLAAALLFPILLVVGVLCFKRQKAPLDS